MKPVKDRPARSAEELEQALQLLEQRFRTLVEISSGFYWEQDRQFRFTLMTGPLLDQSGADARELIGKTRWDMDRLVPVSGGGKWDEHRAVLEARLPFDDFIYKFIDAQGELRYFSTAGQPTFSDQSRFIGYRGIARDITARVQLQRRAAAEHGVTRLLADASNIPKTSTAILRILCETLGWACGSRWELDPESQTLHIREGWSIAAAGVEEFQTASRREPSIPLRGDGLVRKACLSGEPQWMRNVSKNPAFRRADAAAKAGLRSGFAFPIVAGAKVLGAMEFFSIERSHEAEAELLRAAASIGRGIGQFFERKQAEEELLRFRAAMDASPDMIHVTDRASMRFLYVNERGCQLSGYTRQEVLQLGPLSVLRTDRAELERTYDEAIAAGPEGTTVEVKALTKDGTRTVVEVRRRALLLGNRWIIVTISQDVSPRKRAEQSTLRLGRMFAALSATNEAIMRARSPEELYRNVCEAAVRHGQFVNAAALLHDPESSRFNTVSASGKDTQSLRLVEISSDPSRPHGRGLVAGAFGGGKPCVSNDVLQDERMLAWREILKQDGVEAAAAVPLMRMDRAIGVLFFESSEKHSFDEEIVKLLERMAENVVFALDNFNREAERERAEQALRESEEKYRAVLVNMSDGYFEVDLAGNFTFFNDTLCRLQGYTREEMAGMNYHRYYDEETVEKVRAVYNRVFRTGEPAQFMEWPYIRKDGSTGIYESSVQLIVDSQGKPSGFRGVSRDVTHRRMAEEALRASEEKYRLILESIEEAYYEVDLAGNLVFFNAAFRRMLGYPENQLIGMNNRRYQAPEMAAKVYKIFNQVYRTDVPMQGFDFDIVRPDGERVLGEGSVYLVKDAGGKPAGFRGMLRNVTTRRQMEQALRDSEARFRALTDLSSDWYWEQDTDFRFIRIEGRQENVEDWTRVILLGKRGWDTGLEIDGAGGWDAHRALLAAHEPYRDVVMRLTLPEGKRYISVSGEPVFDKDGGFAGYRGVAREITKQKLVEERVQYLATHDGLTGLPNRGMFSELLNVAIQSSMRHERKSAVLFIDLDRFKVINDTLGHEAGDVLLKEMAMRLTQCVRASDVVARLGGDEFVVLLQEVNEPVQVAAVARKILSTILKPLMVMDHECRVTASIGICMYPTDAQDEQSLMKNADIAMYLAKEEGKNNFQFYSENIKAQSIERLMLESHLRRALERQEFSLHYQAKLNLATERITGVEALLRWQHPTLGTVSPAQFIPLAEETGLIVPIGKWVLETACAQAVAWQREGLPPVRVAVNLSARQFGDEHLLRDIGTALQETGLDPTLLELEITEGMVMQNADRAVKILDAIERMGVHLAIDDFGTGYSSLAQIKRFPIDTLKIDRSFIRDIPQDAEDKAIAQAIIAMGKSLGLTVVAEGVETVEQVRFLRQHGCDEMQGYYFSKPVVPEQFADLLRRAIPDRERNGDSGVRS